MHIAHAVKVLPAPARSKNWSAESSTYLNRGLITYGSLATVITLKRLIISMLGIAGSQISTCQCHLTASHWHSDGDLCTEFWISTPGYWISLSLCQSVDEHLTGKKFNNRSYFVASLVDRRFEVGDMRSSNWYRLTFSEAGRTYSVSLCSVNIGCYLAVTAEK